MRSPSFNCPGAICRGDLHHVLRFFAGFDPVLKPCTYAWGRCNQPEELVLRT